MKMKGIDLVVALLAIALVAGSIWYNVRKKKRGENLCGCSCEGCGRQDKNKKSGSCHH